MRTSNPSKHTPPEQVPCASPRADEQDSPAPIAHAAPSATTTGDTYPAWPICLVLILLAIPGFIRMAEPQDRSEPVLVVQSCINPNTAPWWEMTVLPRIGETIAKAIVEHRETAKSRPEESHDVDAPHATNDLPVFGSPEDLENVHRIGPKTVKLIAPHLCFE